MYTHREKNKISTDITSYKYIADMPCNYISNHTYSDLVESMVVDQEIFNPISLNHIVIMMEYRYNLYNY